jgi:hypothetical protein
MGSDSSSSLVKEGADKDGEVEEDEDEEGGGGREGEVEDLSTFGSQRESSMPSVETYPAMRKIRGKKKGKGEGKTNKTKMGV